MNITRVTRRADGGRNCLLFQKNYSLLFFMITQLQYFPFSVMFNCDYVTKSNQ